MILLMPLYYSINQSWPVRILLLEMGHILYHGVCDIFIIWSGSWWFVGVDAKQGMHCLTTSSTWLIPGNHTLSCSNCLVLTRPWSAWRASGMTTLFSNNSIMPCSAGAMVKLLRIQKKGCTLISFGVDFHSPFSILDTTSWMIGSLLEASVICSTDRAFGFDEDTMKFKYSSTTLECRNVFSDFNGYHGI